MDKTIEKKFFDAFKINGVVSKCIEYLRAVHDLPETKDTKRDESWEFYIKQVYPEEILKYTNAFNFKVLELNDSPLMNEIKANFNSCLYEVERREYLFSLLAPFGEQGCNIAGVFTPTEQNEWTLYVRDQFRRMIGKGAWVEENSVEECLSFYYNAMIVFANRLYAFLLSCGIDMMKLQELMGIYLMENPNNNLVNKALGSDNLRQRYIDALPKEPQQEQTTDAQNLTPEPQQEQTKKTRGRGRPKKTFKDRMIDDADGNKLKKIHTKIDGKKGKDATLIILACLKKGWLARPTYTEVKNEFGDIGSKTGYNRYLNESMFINEELEGAIKSLD
ncbi:MAG: hypothetical protein J6Y22_04200 [Paludibacteraceae bacterium]|nr:hypothetical protein [Paludibacteraceae bacterium]MBP5480935.1 hypothetical protein [Paludibacteraceae bacterium]